MDPMIETFNIEIVGGTTIDMTDFRRGHYSKLPPANYGHLTGILTRGGAGSVFSKMFLASFFTRWTAFPETWWVDVVKAGAPMKFARSLGEAALEPGTAV